MVFNFKDIQFFKPLSSFLLKLVSFVLSFIGVIAIIVFFQDQNTPDAHMYVAIYVLTISFLLYVCSISFLFFWEKKISNLKESNKTLTNENSSLKEEISSINDFALEKDKLKDLHIDNLIKQMLIIQYKFHNALLKKLNQDLIKKRGKNTGSGIDYDDSIRSDYKHNRDSAFIHLENLINAITDINCTVALMRNTKEKNSDGHYVFDINRVSVDARAKRYHLRNKTNQFSADQLYPIYTLLDKPREQYLYIKNILEWEKSKQTTFTNTLNPDWRRDYNSVLVYKIINKPNKGEPVEGFLWIDCKQNSNQNIIFDAKFEAKFNVVKRLCEGLLYPIGQYCEKIE